MIFGSVDGIDTDIDYKVISDAEELPVMLRRYWNKRNDYFRNFDSGFLADEEGLYSITPHLAAKRIASRFSGMIVVDGFCGIGGNTIAFARVCKKVIAIELDEQRIRLAKHNARVSGVLGKIEFINGDFFEEVVKLKDFDAVFCSPPWNIKKYFNSKIYSLNDTSPNGFDIFKACKNVTNNIALMLPKHTSIEDLQMLGEVFEIQHLQNQRRRKNNCHFVCVYFGSLIKYEN
eukprot:NODE_409_length_9212_cov_0.585537.p6 type:complete len:232 gc:universal NODE_409_length_9212_cov_0.585537:4981-5676(+)